jgi:hypothetical protein
MRSSNEPPILCSRKRKRKRARARAIAIVAAITAFASSRNASAQQKPVEGFALERLYPSAPGGGWFVMDDLSTRGGLGGAMSLTTGYAHDPLRVATSAGTQRLAVVSDEAFASFGFAATYDRFKLYLDVPMPITIQGQSGAVGAYQLTAPKVAPDTQPDMFGDVRLGFDARILGDPKGAFRLGAGAQLFVPHGNVIRSTYMTDDSARAMGRVLAAGDVGMISYAGHLGVHVRPLDDSPAPGSPRGSELLFGAAAGVRRAMCDDRSMDLVVGPEVFGASAFSSFLSSSATAFEGLLSARVEGTGEETPQPRLKLGAGAGFNDRFGAPEWRVVFGIEIFTRRNVRVREEPPTGDAQ